MRQRSKDENPTIRGNGKKLVRIRFKNDPEWIECNEIGKIVDSSYAIRAKRRDAGIKKNYSSVYEAESWLSLLDQIQIAEAPPPDETSSSTLTSDNSNEEIPQTREANPIFPVFNINPGAPPPIINDSGQKLDEISKQVFHESSSFFSDDGMDNEFWIYDIEDF